MTTLRSNIDKVNGLRYIVDQLKLQTSLAKRFLLSQPFITSESLLEIEFANIEEVVGLLNKPTNSDVFQAIEVKLQQIHDIHGTIKRLSTSENLDDVELFEIKRFAILNQEIAELIIMLKLSFVKLPSLQVVVDILDPDRQNIPNFYIYSSYSPELLKLRDQHKKLISESPNEAEIIRQKAVLLEDEIREQLSNQLHEFVNPLQKALDLISYLDIIIAKAKQAIELNLVKPTISNSNTTYFGLFNPQIKSILEQQNKNFQSIDVELFSAPCLITGVNMGGKTVLLKTIALAQYLFQFGFFVPATTATIVIADKILTSIGDDQSELSGLSSFASEMMKVDEIIKKSRSNIRLLVLIDELARTTNPEEGKAIVNATLDILDENKVRSLITTHYSGLKWNGRKLSVRGLIAEKLTAQLTIKNINDYMDYSLVENGDKVSKNQALEIAKLLCVDDDLLKKASKYL
jgi:DNA mismatch repair ATPase MutS